MRKKERKKHMSFDTNMQVRGQVGVNSLNDIKEGQNVSENQVTVFKKELEAFKNAYSIHAQTVYKNRKVNVSEYGMEGKTGVKAFFQKTKNLCHNIAVAFRPGNENKANNATGIIERSVTELKNAADALKPEDYDALLKTQTFNETIRKLDDARKQIQDHIHLVKDYKDTDNFATRLSLSLTDIGNIEKNLYNGIFNSALKLADSMLNEAFDSLDKYEKKPLGNDFSQNVRTLYEAEQAISNSRFKECRSNGNMDGALQNINSNKILNSLYSAFRIMEKRQNNELVTIENITDKFRHFAEAVSSRTDGMARKLDDLYGKLYEEYSPVLKKIMAQLDSRDDFPSDEEIKTARQTLSENNNLMPRAVSDFIEELDPTEIKTPQAIKDLIKKMSRLHR